MELGTLMAAVGRTYWAAKALAFQERAEGSESREVVFFCLLRLFQRSRSVNECESLQRPPQETKAVGCEVVT